MVSNVQLARSSTHDRKRSTPTIGAPCLDAGRTSLRSEKILACEKVIHECGALLAKGIHINQIIVQNKLPLPPLDLHGVHATLQRAEEMLKNLELKAPGNTARALDLTLVK